MDKVVVTKSKLDSLAQHINAKAGTTGAKTIDQMQATVDGITVGGKLQTKTVTGTGTYTPDEGYDGFSQVEVDIQGLNGITDDKLRFGTGLWNGNIEYEGNYVGTYNYTFKDIITPPPTEIISSGKIVLPPFVPCNLIRKITASGSMSSFYDMPFTELRYQATGTDISSFRLFVTYGNNSTLYLIGQWVKQSDGTYKLRQVMDGGFSRTLLFLEPPVLASDTTPLAEWLRDSVNSHCGWGVYTPDMPLSYLSKEEITITKNGTTTVKPVLRHARADGKVTTKTTYSDGFESVTVNVNVPVPAVQDTKALTITSNGTVSVTPDAPYDALKKVDVTVNVASGGGSPTDPYIEYTSLDSSGRVFTAKFRGTIVPEYAFANLAELTSVDMPDNVIAIGDNGFYRCPKLQLTSLPPGIISLGDYAFSDCSKLALTSLPSGITSIGDQAFRDCSSLALTSLPSRITSIGDYTFRNCGKVALTSLPSGITSIGDFAFLNCYQLSLTTLPSGITSIGQFAFNNCPKLQLTSLPSGITSLPTAAFQYCPKLALTTFPSGLISIGDYAFRQGTGLASITLPPALTSIGDFAFANCVGLETVRFTSTVSSIPNGVFSGCTKLSTIYVPWSQGQVANAPWGASNATIIYDYTEN